MTEEQATRREFIKGVSTPVLLSGGWIDKDGDGEYLDDILGLDDNQDTEQMNVYVGKAVERSEVKPNGAAGYFAIDTGAWYRPTDQGWQKIQSTGENPSFESISSERQLSGEQTFTTTRAGRARIAIISDIHYNEAGGRSGGGDNDVPDGQTILSNLDTFIDEMNNDFQPDAVVVGGDFPDGPLSTSQSELVSWIDTAWTHLTETGGSNGTGLDCDVYAIPGDHEYSYAGSASMQSVYDVFGWNGVEDSYKAVDINGTRLLLINNCYQEVDGRDTGQERIPDSSDPVDQLSWIQSQARAANFPIIPIVHIPISKGDRSTKDTVGNEDAALRYLNESAYMGGGIHCHSHHDDVYDRVRGQFDIYDSMWVNNPTPNSYDGDTSVVPYTMLTVEPDGQVVAKASYDDNTYQRQFGWRTGGGQTNKVSPFARFLQHEDRYYDTVVPANALDDWFQNVDGTLQVDRGRLEGTTGATAGNTTIAIKQIQRLSRMPVKPTFDRPMLITFGGEATTASNQEFIAVWGDCSVSDKTGQHIGIRSKNGTLYVTVADGTSETTKEFTPDSPLSSGSGFGGRLIYRPGNQLEFYSDAGGYVGKIETNLPSGTQQVDKLLTYRIHTTEAVDKEVELVQWEIYNGYPNETLDL